MFPRFSQNDFGNGPLIDSELLPYLSLGNAAIRPHLSNFQNLRRCDNVVISVFASGEAGAPLTETIAPVVEVLTKKQMTRIAARRVIAFVKNVYSIRDRPIFDGPSQSVRTAEPFAIPSKAIAHLRVAGFLPRPTSIFPAGLIYGIPKSLQRGSKLLTRMPVPFEAAVMHPAKATGLSNFGAIIDGAACHGYLFTSIGGKMQANMKRFCIIAGLLLALVVPASAQFTGGNSFGTPGFTAIKAAGASLACSYTPVTTGTQGTAYTGATPSASGGTPAYTFSETGTLPGGLSISSSTGVISGTPTANGSFPTIQVKVTDSTSTVANCGSAFTLVISPSGYTGPGDITSGALAWYGLRAYNAAYATGSNPAVDLVDQVGANPITINILSTGALDVASVSAWVTAHSVTSINVAKLYDQSGNGRHATVGPSAALRIVLSGLGALPTLVNTASALVTTATITQSVPYTISAVAKQATQNNVNIDAILNTSSAAFIYGFTGSSFTSGHSQLYSGSFADGGAATLNAFHAVQALFNGSSSSNYVDGTLTSSLNPGSSGISGETLILFGSGGFNLNGNIQEVGIWGGNQTANNSTMNSNQHTYWGF